MDVVHTYEVAPNLNIWLACSNLKYFDSLTPLTHAKIESAFSACRQAVGTWLDKSMVLAKVFVV